MAQRWKVVAAIGAALAILVVSLPWWLGPVLVPAARMRGLDIGSYQRIGLARFTLRRVRYTRKLVTVTADRLEADTPVLWAWRRLRGRESPITVEGWSVVVAAGPRPPGPSRAGFVPLHATLRRVAAGLRRWLPEARVSDGRVRWPGGGLALAGAEWKSGALTAGGLSWLGREMEVKADFSPSGPIAVRVTDRGADWSADLVWRESAAGGRMLIWSQPVAVDAAFAPLGWLPARGTAYVPVIDLPADRAGLGGVYGRIRGAGRLEWREGGFRLSVHASALAAAKGGLAAVKDGAPPLTVAAEAEGTRARWTLRTLEVSLPGAEARLDGPVSFPAGRFVALNPARLTFDVDLARLPLGSTAGKVQGWAAWGGPSAAPSAKAERIPLEFHLQATSAAWRSWSAEKLSVAGSLAWPRLTVASAVFDLDPDDRVTARGTYDFSTRAVAGAQAAGKLGRSWLARVLPAALQAESADFAVSASGSPANLDHQGTLQASGVRLAPLRPLAVRAAWSGRGLRAGRLEAHLTAGKTEIDAIGAADARGLRLTDLRFSPGGLAVWRLTEPAAIGWEPGLSVDRLRLAGGTASLDLNWDGTSGSIAVSHFSSAWCRDLITLPELAWDLRSLRMDGRIAAGRLSFSTRAEAAIEVPGRPAVVSLRARGDGTTIFLDEAELSAGGAAIATAAGKFPLGWDAAARPHWRIDEDAPLELRVRADPDSPFWDPLGRGFGLILSRPRAEIRLSGTLRRPRGEIDAGLGRLSSARLSGPGIPSIEDLALRVHADPTDVVVDSLTGRIAGQPLRATGRWPVGPGGAAGFWRAWDWRNAEARLEVTDADLAPLAAAFPKILAPKGRWDLRLALARGDWSGSLRVRDAATRPSPPFGIIQAISADATIAGRTLEVQDLGGEIGGQRMRVQGRAVFPAGGAPQFSFTLQGDNIPFVRQADMLMRADFRLRADPEASGGTLVSGSVNLRDGLFLADLADLLPRGASGVARAPPFFAVDIPPFARWRLAVDLTGNRSIRLRTALFRGEASARFRLSGTLQEPQAVGEVRVDQGQIILPFATFEVQLGSVRLTAVDPFTPEVDVVATAERYDYDLRMKAAGPADSPTITFTSNPALPSDQVLLLVMTGQVPTFGAPIGGTTTQVAGFGAYLGQGLFSGSGSSRLGVISGQQISEKGKPTYEIEYKLNDRWSLLGEYDQFDDYNAGVKWRVFRQGARDGPP